LIFGLNLLTISVHMAKGQIHPLAYLSPSPGHGVPPALLRCTTHQKHRSVLQRKRLNRQCFTFLVTQHETPNRPQTDRSNDGATAQLFFTVAMPSHAVLSVTVEIQQHTVKTAAGLIFNSASQLGEFIQPRQRLVDHA